MAVKVTKPQVNVREEVSKLAGLGSLAYQDSDYLSVGGLIVKEDSDADSVLKWPVEINLNSDAEWSGSYNLSNSGNHGPIAMYLNNDDASITESEVSLLMSAGGSGSAQHQLTVKRTGTNTGDLIFLRRTSGGASAESLRIDTNGKLNINEAPSSGTGEFDSAELVRVNGDAWSDSTDNQLGLSLATTTRATSAPIYFNEEKNENAKAIYQESYYIVVRGHNNEGIKFKGNGNPANTTYQFNGTNNSSSCFNASNSANWNTTSDERIKENIQALPNGSLAKINALRPVTFDYSDEWADKMAWWQFDEDGNKLDFNPERKNNEIGWIAQEYETIFPEDVTTSEETVGENTYEDFRTLKPDSVVPHLVKAVQELSAQVEALQAEINTLKGE